MPDRLGPSTSVNGGLGWLPQTSGKVLISLWEMVYRYHLRNTSVEVIGCDSTKFVLELEDSTFQQKSSCFKSQSGIISLPHFAPSYPRRSDIPIQVFFIRYKYLCRSQMQSCLFAVLKVHLQVYSTHLLRLRTCRINRVGYQGYAKWANVCPLRISSSPQ